MDLFEARSLAMELMRKHGLSGWNFAFDHARRRFGCCRHHDRCITLSRMLTFLNPREQVEETILHEIAHALTPGAGHGPKWRARCRQIGISPQRCYTEAEVKAPPRRAARYLIGCKACDWWADRRRVTSAALVCRRCRQPVVYREKLTGVEFVAGRKGR